MIPRKDTGHAVGVVRTGADGFTIIYPKLAEQQRRKAKKQRRKRGLRGLLRKLVKAARKLGR